MARIDHHHLEQTVQRAVHARYAVRLPERGAGPYPAILFLHGAGERGDDLARVTVHGPWRRADAHPDYPFAIVAPQCPAGEIWRAEPLLAVLDDALARFPIDPARVYLTGLSMGGYGTWVLGLAHPERFAAIAPICGPSYPHLDPLPVPLPIWIFHGAKDELVPWYHSQWMVERLGARGAGGEGAEGEVRLTIHPDLGHDVWVPVYDGDELYDWFLSHRRMAQGAK